VRAFIDAVYAFALAIGAPGLFIVTFLDSSFVPLPQINDLLVVLMVTGHKSWVVYYALMATAGSVAGCYVIYYLADKGGAAFVRTRLKPGHLERGLKAYQRYGVLALVVPALLPPPAPFKLFVLAAGLAGVRPLQFVTALTIARGIRFLTVGILAVYFGDAALELMREHGVAVSLALVGLILLTVVLWWLRERRIAAASSMTQNLVK
jgi:membrane protein YqaA with SNARE-associated domain